MLLKKIIVLILLHFIPGLPFDLKSYLLNGYKKYHEDLRLREDEVMKNIQIATPTSLEEFINVIDNLKAEVDQIRNDKQVRLIIIDSLSMPILCTIEDPRQRPYYYSRILYKLHRLSIKNDLAIVITNEWITQIDKDGKAYCTAAGGQYVSDYAHIKLESTTLPNNKFALRVVKSPIMPQISVTFTITEDGIRNVI